MYILEDDKEPTIQELKEFEQTFIPLLDKELQEFSFELSEEDIALAEEINRNIEAGIAQTCSSEELTHYQSTQNMMAFMDRAINGELLSAEVEFQLANLAEAGDEEAAGRVFSANLMLVILISLRHKETDLTLDDLWPEAFTALSRAWERFQCQSGIRFKTYAAWWIEKTVSQIITERINGTYKTLNEGRAEIASKLRIQSEDVPSILIRGVRKKVVRTGKTTESVRRLRSFRSRKNLRSYL